jgi:hypothetical protein
MVILQINYCYRNVTRAERETRYTDALAAKFLKVDGLNWKIWLDSPDEPRVGGIYLFDSRAAAEAYLAGPIVAGLRASPEVHELECRIFDVRERMSEITRAPIAWPAAVAAE